MFKRLLTTHCKMLVKPIKMRWNTGGVNYCYLLSSKANDESWLIDPAEFDEVQKELTVKELNSVTAIVNTHHHYDHSNGNFMFRQFLKSKGKQVDVIGGSKKSPGVKLIPGDMDELTLGELTIKCIRTPCHTQDSICYLVKDNETEQQCLFTGDTLFTAGCGRFFEGDAEQMDQALNNHILEAVGGTEEDWKKTVIYPGHEYTKSNVRFVRNAIYKSRGDNDAFDRLEQFANENEMTTGLFTLSDELEFNPFMRLDDPLVREAVNDSTNTLTREEVMSGLREMKNSM